MLMPMRMGSPRGPVRKASWATPIAKIPASKLPTALLKPRLKVAPLTKKIFKKYLLLLHHKINTLKSSKKKKKNVQTNCIFEHYGHSDDGPNDITSKHIVRCLKKYKQRHQNHSQPNF